MKAVFLQILVLCFLATVTTGQQPSYVLEKLRTIDLLTTTREDLRMKLAEFNLETVDEPTDSFSSHGLDVEITYTSGGCDSESDEDFDFWSVPSGRPLSVEVEIQESITAKELEFMESSFGKEPRFEGSTSSFIYFDKERGVSFETVSDEGIEVVERITFFPRRSKRDLLCENNIRAKKFYQEKKVWFDSEGLKRRATSTDCQTANVTGLSLDITEISGSSKRTINVASVVSNPSGDPLGHKFIVSAGSVRGKGTNVVWDLTGVAPGTYTIAAAVDDGCGFCGRTETRSIVVR